MYKFNYASTPLGVQSQRENISGGSRTKKVEYNSCRESGVITSKNYKEKTHKIPVVIRK